MWHVGWPSCYTKIFLHFAVKCIFFFGNKVRFLLKRTDENVVQHPVYNRFKIDTYVLSGIILIYATPNFPIFKFFFHFHKKKTNFQPSIEWYYVRTQHTHSVYWWLIYTPASNQIHIHIHGMLEYYIHWLFDVDRSKGWFGKICEANKIFWNYSLVYTFVVNKMGLEDVDDAGWQQQQKEWGRYVDERLLLSYKILVLYIFYSKTHTTIISIHPPTHHHTCCLTMLSSFRVDI